MSPSSAVEVGYAGYQLIRNVLAAYAEGCSFCVMHDDRRSDLREAWYEVLAAPGSLPSWRFGRIGDGAAIQSEPRYSGKQSKRRLAITNVRSATPYVVKRYR
jgi:hypothetical protein